MTSIECNVTVNGASYAYTCNYTKLPDITSGFEISIDFKDKSIPSINLTIPEMEHLNMVLCVMNEVAMDAIIQSLTIELPKKPPVVIQLLGQARAGKDFTATSLKEYYESQGLTVEIKSYAAPMKRMAATLFGITLEQLDEAKNNPSNYPIYCGDVGRDYCELDFRTFLQRLGNDATKPEFGDSVWADLMKSEVAKSQANVIVIPDCRFLTEVEAFPNAVLVRVINNSLEPPMDHASELELTEYPTDYVIDNTNYRDIQSDLKLLADEVIKA